MATSEGTPNLNESYLPQLNGNPNRRIRRTSIEPGLPKDIHTEKEKSTRKPSTLANLKSGGLGFLKGLKWVGKRGAAVGGTVFFGALTLASAGIIPATGLLLAHLSLDKENNRKSGAGWKALFTTGAILASPLVLALYSANYVIKGEWDI